jgi:hypothetical protein
MNIEEILAEEARERIRDDLRKKEKLLLEKPYLNPEEYKNWIEETELKVFNRTIRCPACGSPDLKWDGVTLASNPPWYPHYCLDCSYSVNLQETYPSTVYRPR